MSGNNSGSSIYINHTEKEIRYSGDFSVYRALAQIGWDTDDDVECHNLYVAELLPVALSYLTALVTDLVKEHCYTISGAAASQLSKDAGLGQGYEEHDTNTYIFDKEADAVLCIETGEYKAIAEPSTTTYLSSPSSSTTSLSSYDVSTNSEEVDESTDTENTPQE
jgi:hypothetical protein